MSKQSNDLLSAKNARTVTEENAYKKIDDGIGAAIISGKLHRHFDFSEWSESDEIIMQNIDKVVSRLKAKGYKVTYEAYTEQRVDQKYAREHPIKAAIHGDKTIPHKCISLDISW